MPNTAQSGARITALGADNFGPAWSSTNANRYINPTGTFDYLAWARGTSPAARRMTFTTCGP